MARIKSELSVGESTSPNHVRVYFRSGRKADAQETIRTIRAWARANGLRSKLVQFWAPSSAPGYWTANYHGYVSVQAVANSGGAL